MKANLVKARSTLFFTVHLLDDVFINSNQEAVIACYLDKKTNVFNKKPLLFQPLTHKANDKGILVATAIVKPSQSIIPVRIFNVSCDKVKLNAETLIGTVELCSTQKPEIKVNKISISSQSDKLHLKQLVNSVKTNHNLSDTQKARTVSLINNYGHIFSSNETEVGYCSDVFHEIITPDVPPIHSRPRRIPSGLEEKVDEEINRLLEGNIIRESKSPWNSPVVVVKKADGKIRLCIDYRELNAVTIRPIYPIPDSKSLFDSLDGSIFFSTVDLSKAYYQCPVKEVDKCKTAFSTRTGQYEFNRMPFGLCGAPATFQRLMHTIFKKENWSSCLIYLDDVLVFGKSFDEHLKRLETIFLRFSESGLKLSPSKCDLLQTSVNFLGHKISSAGIYPDENKIRKIQEWEKPCTFEQLSTFLGFTNYYRKFIKNYESFTTPLEMLFQNGDQSYRNKKKNKMLEWNPQAEKCFNMLKEKLCSPPILSFPTNKDTFILDTDASFSGMGAVLSQCQNGLERVIEYGSKKFTRSEQKYCVTRKELLAIYTFLLQYRHYLLGRNFKIRTDHKALTWLLNWDKPSTSQYCRWIAEIQQFDFIIEHRKGKDNTNADILSRLDDCEQCCLKHEDPKVKTNVKVFNMNISNLDCKEVISKYHSTLGHVGASRLVQILRDSGYSFPNMHSQVTLFCKQCIYCAERKSIPNPQNQQLSITANSPFEKVMLDLSGPLPRSKDGYRYILAVVDVFSRYSTLVPLKSTETEVILDAFLLHWLSLFGCPQVMISDNAPNFNSSVFSSFCHKFNIVKLNSSPYYPQGNGIVERLFRSCKDMIYATTKEKKVDWVQSLPYVAMGLRCSKSSTISAIPHEVIFGKTLKLPWDQVISSKPVYSYHDYIRTQTKLIENQQRKVMQRESILVRQKFTIGEMVMIQTNVKGFNEKKYFGPGKISQYCGNKTYIVEYFGKRYRRNEQQLKHYSHQVIHSHNSTSIHSRKMPNFRENQARHGEPKTRYPRRQRKPAERYGYKI